MKKKKTKTQYKPFVRAELQAIRERALDVSEGKGIHQSWVRAYLQLADATNYLDAMCARCEIVCHKTINN